MASVKPPVDKHSQNLTLHCIELQHHKRRMRLMLMAAQHQYGEAGVYDIDFSVFGNVVTIVITVYFLCLGFQGVGRRGEWGGGGGSANFNTFSSQLILIIICVEPHSSLPLVL